jgi:hypothetical protein
MYPITVGPLVLSGAQNASNGTTTYLGTVTGGGTNLFVGLMAYVVGFSLNDGVNNTGQNGYLVTANSTTTITLANPGGVAETAAASVYLFITNADGPYIPAGGTAGVGPATTVSSPNNQSGPGLDSPGAPGGKSLIARNFYGGWNYTNGQLSSQNYLAALTAARNSGTGWSAVDGFTPSGGKNTAQTTPLAPSGTFTQQGTPALTNVTAVTLSGFAPGQCSFVQFTGAYQSK